MLNDIKPKTIEQFINAKKKVELFALNLEGVVATGLFGEVTEPSISDIDFFICFDEKHLKVGTKSLLDFIKQNQDLSYYFIHAPLIISSNEFEYLTLLHTLKNLKINFVKEEIIYKKERSKEYQDFLNVVWTLFLIPPAVKILHEFKSTNLRRILHVLKNLHQSADNLNSLKNIVTDNKKRSGTIRKKVLEEGADSAYILNEFRDALNVAVSLLDNINIESKEEKGGIKKIAISRNLAIQVEKRNTIKNSKLIYCSTSIFKIVSDISSLKSENHNIKQYIEASLKAYNNSRKNNVPYQFVTPFGINFFDKSLSAYLIGIARNFLYNINTKLF